MFKSLFFITILSTITITHSVTVSGYVYYQNRNEELMTIPNAEIRGMRADNSKYIFYADNTGYYSRTVSGTGIDSLMVLELMDNTYYNYSMHSYVAFFFTTHNIGDTVHNIIRARPLVAGYVKSKILSYPENEEQDTALSGFKVNIGDTSVLTDNNGYYECEIPCNTNITILPDTEHFTFSPTNVNCTNPANMTHNDITVIFTGEIEYFNVSGYVFIENGDTLPNIVQLRVSDLFGESFDKYKHTPLFTDINGYFNIPIPYNWIGRIYSYLSSSPSTFADYRFYCGYYKGTTAKIGNIEINYCKSDTNVNFMCYKTGKKYIHGVIKDSDDYSIEGVSLSFSGTNNGTAITDSEGKYVRSIYSYWEGKITPTKQGYIFNPSFYTVPFQSNLPDSIDIDFIAILNNKPKFTSKSKDTVNISSAFNYTITYANPIGGNVEINILNKPAWMQFSNGVVLSGIPSITGKDTALVELVVNGKSYDTLLLHIVIDVIVSFTSVTMDTAVLNTPFDYHLKYTPIVDGITFNVFKKPEWLSLDLTLLRGTPPYGGKIDTAKVELLYENVPFDTLVLSILIESPVGVIKPGAFVKNKIIPEVHIYNLLGRKVLITPMAKRYPTLGTGIYHIVYRIDKKRFIQKLIIGKKF